MNEVICHGIPDQYKLQDGDICNIDVSAFHRGFHSDLNETLLIGNVDQAGRFLVENTRKCLDLAIEQCRPGTAYRTLGNIIHDHAASCGLEVVRTYCGHGINTEFHPPPNIPHYRETRLRVS